MVPHSWVTPPLPQKKGEADTDGGPEIIRDKGKEKSTILKEKRKRKSPILLTFRFQEAM